MDVDKRVLLYIIPLIVLPIAGLFIGTSPQLTSEAIFIALGIIISLVLDLARKQLFGEKEKFSIITNESQLVGKYNEFKEEAITECWLTWTTIYKVPDLDDYFEKERNLLAKRKSLKIRRMVGTAYTNWTREQLAKHLKDYEALIASGSYACRETHTAGIEIVYADYKEKGNSYCRALLILNEDERKIGFLFDEKDNHEQIAMVRAVKAFFESEWNASASPEIKSTAGKYS